jgi:hypothetical protein
MYIEAVPNRKSPPAILLRESYRDKGKVRKRTLCNLTHWPAHLIEGLRALLKDGSVLPPGVDALTIRRSLPHGHIAAVLGRLRTIGLDRLLGPAGNRCRDLTLAMIVARLIAPASKLATAKALDPATAAHSLGAVLGLGAVDEDELYTALDWLAERQPAIEAALARRHLKDGTLVLYDVSSSYVEGRCCELASFGHNRDGKKGKLQIVYGLLCAADGCPVAIEVFDGATADPKTLAPQIKKLKQRFALEHVVLVGDRGMITQARIDDDLRSAGLDWITSLRAPSIRALAEGGTLQLGLFDERDMAAITSPDYPDERLIVCRNPELARERSRKREDLLAATEKALAVIQRAVERRHRPLRGATEIALKAGAVVDTHKMAKHFTLTISSDRFTFARRPTPLPPRRRWTASTSCAPACPPLTWTMSRPCALTNRSPLSSAPSARSKPSICRSGRSITGSAPASAPTYSCACSAITSNGICAPGWRPCSTTTTTARPPQPCAPASSPRPAARWPLKPSRPAALPTTACPSTASRASWPTSPR